jgi:hypothetical protein
MRTTLTVDDDLARMLKERARSTGRPFKEIVNEVLRKGLALGNLPTPDENPFVVQAKACGFRTGIDPTKLNQIYDELEIEDLRGENGFGVHEP